MLNSAGLTSSCLLKLHLAGQAYCVLGEVIICAAVGRNCAGSGMVNVNRESMKNIKKSESDSWLWQAAGGQHLRYTDVRLLKSSGTGFTHTDAHRR
jgi:hypothetical protein